MDEKREDEKLAYQYATNYRAYRRVMMSTRITAAVIAAGCAWGFAVLSVVLAAIVCAMLLFAGAISVLVSLHNERTLIVFNTRLVIINKDKRKYLSFANIFSVTYKIPFYERDLMTGTVTVTAKTAKGGTKKYKIRHLFDAGAGVRFIQDQLEKQKTQGDD